MELDFSPVWAGLPQLLAGALVTVEITAASLLLGCVMLVAVYAAPLKHYTDAMARQLLDIHSYATQVLGPQQHNGISLSTRPYTGHMPATQSPSLLAASTSHAPRHCMGAQLRPIDRSATL